MSPARPSVAMVAILDLLWMAGLTLPLVYWLLRALVREGPERSRHLSPENR